MLRLCQEVGKKQFVERVGEYTVLTTSMNSASSFQLMLKRLIDIVGGLVGCILTGIICIFVGPAIYIASPGPIFFAQERIGKNGKHFKVYKFRSMYLDAEERKAELMKDNKLSDGKVFNWILIHELLEIRFFRMEHIRQESVTLSDGQVWMSFRSFLMYYEVTCPLLGPDHL